MQTGIIKNYNAEKGYGFISRDGGDDLFFHYSVVQPQSSVPMLRKDVQVSFEEGRGPKGANATRVELVGAAADEASEDMDMAQAA
jgi:cold shock protein